MSGWRLFGVAGWGSTLAEGALAWAGEDFEFVDVEGFDSPGLAREALLAVNPLARVPTLIAPDGRVLTESAAIILLLSELKPESGLAPPPGHASRPAFLNRLAWFVSAVYPTFTYRDYPERWAPDAADQLAERVDSFRSPCGFSSRRNWAMAPGCWARRLRRSISTSPSSPTGGRGGPGSPGIARSSTPSLFGPSGFRRWRR